MITIDPTFSVNDFNKPKVLTPMETNVNNILMLLFGKPGFYPSIPTLGMDIKQYLYEFFDDIDTGAIKAKLGVQCKDFLPEISSGEFDVQKVVYQDRNMLIFILPIIDDTNRHDVAIGVTTNSKGELIYRFTDNKIQSL